MKRNQKPSNQSRRPVDHVAGSMQEAAVRVFFERGSKEAIERNRWAVVGILSLGVAILAISSAIALLVTQKVYVFQALKDTNGLIRISEAGEKFQADEDTQMAWASRWMSELTEVTPATWQRNVRSVQAKSVGVGADQVKAYLQQLDNNPAQLVHRFPTYVREYQRTSVNKVAPMTYLIRYELTSRPAAGVDPIRKSYAATITLTNIGHSTRDDVFSNPEGLATLNFSISDEASK